MSWPSPSISSEQAQAAAEALIKTLKSHGFATLLSSSFLLLALLAQQSLYVY
jgi:hypothetical protein